jgi:hypothetical protein
MTDLHHFLGAPMNPVNLYATARGDFAIASSLTVEEALAVRYQLSPDEILYDLSAEARSAVLASYGMRAHQTPQGHVVVIWGVKQPTVAQTGNA